MRKPNYQKKYREQNKLKHKEYMRAYTYEKKYGISVTEYETLLESQGGVCALCQCPPKGKKIVHLCVDHDHKTGKVRGLLCTSCNSALGKLGDSVEGINRVLQYLGAL